MKVNIRTSLRRCPDVLHVMSQESESGIKEEENKLLDIKINIKMWRKNRHYKKCGKGARNCIWDKQRKMEL